MAVVVATGITADGTREVLGLDVGDSEDEMFWRGFLLTLKQRGLGGVQLVISDQHSGLVAALRRPSRAPRTNAAGSTSPATCSPTSPRPTPTWSPRCSARSSPNPTPTTVDADLGRGPRPARRHVPQDRTADGRRQGRGARVHRASPRPTGARSGRPTRSSGSTRRSSAAPASSGSSPTTAAVIRLVGAVLARHARRMDRRRPPLPLRRLHGHALPDQRYWRPRRRLDSGE